MCEVCIVQFKDGPKEIPVAQLLRRVTVPNGPDKTVHVAIVRCPFCCQEHEHGWLSGPRTPHCVGGRPEGAGDYYVDCPEDTPRQRR
ncbi:hypothetical protein [Propylenella binzhouense]|uniref:Uncharacterized protein n=1 Tax=Propylenella binzhouense TaxID=2555902 RepID=A0A964WTT9_9HYPH|nr:hypothetical protein [Propylenella binzhouense]MYZ48349.1 hypothetical protein [Propylenella binzhouense]